MLQYRVALEASTSRPSTSRAPRVSSSSAAWSFGGPSPSPAGTVLRDARAPRAGRPGRAGWAGRCARLPETGSGIADPVTVLPGADVALLVQRQPAQRAGGPPLRHDLQRPL